MGGSLNFKIFEFGVWGGGGGGGAFLGGLTFVDYVLYNLLSPDISPWYIYAKSIFHGVGQYLNAINLWIPRYFEHSK